MKNFYKVIALAFIVSACNHEEEVIKPIKIVPVDTATVATVIDTTRLSGKDSISWQHINRVRGGVFEQASACEKAQSFTYTKSGRFHFYSLPGAPCGPYDNGWNNTYEIKSTMVGTARVDSLILHDLFQPSARMKVVKLTADTLRISFTDNQVIFVDTFVPHPK